MKKIISSVLIVLLMVGVVSAIQDVTLNYDEGIYLELEIVQDRFDPGTDFWFSFDRLESDYDNFYNEDVANIDPDYCDTPYSTGSYDLSLDFYSSFCYHDADSSIDYYFSIDEYTFFTSVSLNQVPFTGDGWYENSAVVNGISGATGFSPTVYEIEGVKVMIAGLYGGNWLSYYWDDVSSWVRDDSYISGLTDNGGRGSIAIWDDAGTIKSATGFSTGSGVYGYYWSGSNWVSDNNIVTGLPASYYSMISAMDIDGDLVLFRTSVSPNAYLWNGSSWNTDASYSSGLILEQKPVNVFYNDGYKIIQTGGTPVGLYWSGSEWVEDATIVGGMFSDSNDQNHATSIFDLDGTLSAIKVTDDGATVNGLDWNGTYVPATTQEIVSQGDITVQFSIAVEPSEVSFGTDWVYVDSGSSANVPANINFSNAGADAFPLRNGELCGSYCSNIVNDGDYLSFNVSGWSNYSYENPCSTLNATCTPCSGGYDQTNLENEFIGYNWTTDTNGYGDITGWDVSCITDMSGAFYNSNFNQDIGGWNVSNVTDMGNLFYDTPFNQDISSWDVSDVVYFWNMFQDNTVFNQDISGWNTSNALRLSSMFSGATSFDQDIGGWDVSGVDNANAMFNDVTLSTSNYDALLEGWSNQVVQTNVPFTAGNSTYTNQTARDILTNPPNNWAITDGGAYVTPTPPTIITRSPLTNPTVNEGDLQVFNITVSEDDNDTLNYVWEVDSNDQSNNQSVFTFNTTGYNNSALVEVTVSDKDGNDTTSWTVTINEIVIPSGYLATYDESDIAPITINFIAKILVTFVLLAGIIGIIIITIIGRKQLNKK